MSAKPVHGTDSNFKEMVSKNLLTLINCWAPRCSPYVVMAPIVKELAKGYAGKALVRQLNVDENPGTARRFQIFGIPTLLIFKNEEKVNRIVGLVPKSHIEARLKNIWSVNSWMFQNEE